MGLFMTERKEKALAALIACGSRQEAAALIGISPRTIYSYMQDEEFIAAYRSSVLETIESATRKVQLALSPAVETLSAICADQEAPCMARISAARALLEYGVRMTETTDILTKLEELEREQHNQKTH